MNEHPHDLLPAFALGTLDVDEANQVMRHVAACAACRADLESWGMVVGLLPYTVAPQAPPVAIKSRLLAMIDMSGPRAKSSRVSAGPWMNAAAACSLALALVLGLLLVTERGRTDTLTAQLDRERREAVFISNAVSQPLRGAWAGAKGKMFMQPGSTHAVLMLYGLKPMAAGKVYQLWLANADQKVPLDTFTVGPDGAATLAIEAPAPVDSYGQVMVTMEQAPGSLSPSNEVVLEAPL